MALDQFRVAPRHKHTVVAILDCEADVVEAVRRLHELGLENDQISLLAKDNNAVEHAIHQMGAVNGREIEPADTLAEEVEPKGRDEVAGMAIGAGVGFVLGLTAIAIPGFGAFLLAAGPLAIGIHALTTSAAGLGLGALLGALLDEKVTEEHRDFYKQQLEQGCWILVVHGDEGETARAASALRQDQHLEHVDCF